MHNSLLLKKKDSPNYKGKDLHGSYFHRERKNTLNALLKKPMVFSRTTGPISTELGTKHPLVKGIQVCLKKNHLILITFIIACFSLNKRYDIIIWVYWIELFSKVKDVAHGPLVW